MGKDTAKKFVNNIESLGLNYKIVEFVDDIITGLRNKYAPSDALQKDTLRNIKKNMKRISKSSTK